jgi:hypothetical protein
VKLITQATTLERQNPQIQPTIDPYITNKAVSDWLHPANPQDNFQIYYQNVNGILSGKGTGKRNEINEFIHTNNIAIYGLTETNVE